MKNLVLMLLLGIGIASAQSETVNIKGQINNRNSDSIVIQGPKKFRQVVRLDPNGNFTASLNTTTGLHRLFDGSEQTFLYLKNGYDLTLNMDAAQFDESIVYTGTGANENNVLAQQGLANERFDTAFYTFEEDTDFTTALELREKEFSALVAAKPLDPDFKSYIENTFSQDNEHFTEMYTGIKAIRKLPGTISADYDFENHKGGRSKLSELRGKYVYIDIWATWCGPCRQEIPHLKRIEALYHGKNIEFVSISIDVAKDHEKWRKFVTDKQLGGTQLFADKDWNSDFITAYGVKSIPRFLLIDPQGSIISADAARPSDPLLQQQLDKLLD